MIYSADRKFYRLDDVCPAASTSQGFYGSMQGAGYLVAVLIGAVSAIWLQGFLS